MSSVFEKLQTLVTTVVSPIAQRSPPTLTPATFDAAACDAALLQLPLTKLDTPEPVGVLSGDTLRPATRRRHRRQTDATDSSISTVASADQAAVAATGSPPVSRQDIDRLLPHRMADLERLSRLHPVSKVLQQDSWDCGLACVCMILRTFGYTTCTIAQLARQAQTDSIWTIDLAYLLHHFLRADFTYYTKCLGINPEHTQHDFYRQDLDDDEARVQRLFARARRDAVIQIVEIVIPLIDLKRFLVHRQYVAILLVDSAMIKCIACEKFRRAATAHASHHHGRSRSMNLFSFAGSRPPPTTTGASAAAAPAGGMFTWFSRRRQIKDGYLGHYILLIAYIPSLDVFLYRDPGIPEEYCLATACTINTARNRPGTDADCIILKL
ncbi:hypothetical protein GGI04_003963 [Coemansia thaxteri]|uniref:Guanylyl cyclase n=1 Tax=Coemansia thaxteri TaxID=2663907 RepID=A0A9W8EJV9_9FUNG|nr:hypothetical protein GGI04_003963 [Coemansia thaxteri]KAJ2007453.1 hypothetical protein H4R26_000778 [Coemansia thaxteri]KAJ2472412.1 hypothetical protein GGI02_001590 [Coemansia sp. RSA 2322]KAJ2486988.1 hypothetical protein EV174_000789 [Coemansia sp. RSA 2320]